MKRMHRVCNTAQAHRIDSRLKRIKRNESMIPFKLQFRSVRGSTRFGFRSDPILVYGFTAFELIYIRHAMAQTRLQSAPHEALSTPQNSITFDLT